MQFLKYLFWCLLAFLAALFTFGNWFSVEIHLWGGLIALVNLPFLLLVTFLLGLLPMLLYHLTARWRLRQRLQTTERTVEALRVSLPPEPAPMPAALPSPTATP
jgi:apolipoprotein N-acyltransferase